MIAQLGRRGRIMTAFDSDTMFKRSHDARVIVCFAALHAMHMSPRLWLLHIAKIDATVEI